MEDYCCLRVMQRVGLILCSDMRSHRGELDHSSTLPLSHKVAQGLPVFRLWLYTVHGSIQFQKVPEPKSVHPTVYWFSSRDDLVDSTYYYTFFHVPIGQGLWVFRKRRYPRWL